MKTYVFIAHSICEIGGAQQYQYNKSKFLEAQGWRVFIFSGRPGRILINSFERYRQYIYPALSYAPECYARWEVNRTIDKIIKTIGSCEGDPCIVESDEVNKAIWAELIAKRLGARHLAFILREKHNYDTEVRQFLRFKYTRHELAGITDSSINQMLLDESVEQRSDTRISTFCNNVVEDCEDRISPQLVPSANFTLGSIGRLEKACVPAIINGFKAFIDRHPDKTFNLVLIGGSSVKTRTDQIKEKMSVYHNVHLVITGNMYPIPLSLLKHIDVFVSTAGSARVSYRCHRPTICVHPVSGEPTGIIGLDYNLNEKTMYDAAPDATIPDCIDRALKNSDRISYTLTEIDDTYYQGMYKEFSRQLSFANIVSDKMYYDERRLMHIKTANINRHFLRWLSGHLFGGKVTDHMESAKKGLKKQAQ